MASVHEMLEEKLKMKLKGTKETLELVSKIMEVYETAIEWVEDQVQIKTMKVRVGKRTLTWAANLYALSGYKCGDGDEVDREVEAVNYRSPNSTMTQGADDENKVDCYGLDEEVEMKIAEVKDAFKQTQSVLQDMKPEGRVSVLEVLEKVSGMILLSLAAGAGWGQKWQASMHIKNEAVRRAPFTMGWTVCVHAAWAPTMVRRRSHELLLWLLLKLLALGCAVALFCELGIYYAVIVGCDWPQLRSPAQPASIYGSAQRGQERASPPVLRALFLADTHLLGALKGHWFDKLRREWQMEQAFQTALWFFEPDAVFILGDLFDEGKWSSPKDFKDDVRRFRMMFRRSTSTELFVVVGNHDIGFHYEMDWYKLQRFELMFNFTSAKVVTRKGINFVLVNSIALQGDGCSICKKVENDLLQLSLALNCSRQLDPNHSNEDCKEKEIFPASAPILLQHYPLYRVSDAECQGEDAATPEEKNLLFQEKYDTLSVEASKKLLWWFRPRLLLSGHTHSACMVLHHGRLPEISIPSFNWRNRNNPSFLLASITATNFSLAKCFMPRESTVGAIYLIAGAMAINLILFHFHCWQWMMQYLINKHKSI
ncbi:metallophosphoesterase 1 [Heptranchias perlo]|uniref:metallophosphoesterase 1 n=1 Tax=Heptranchias perlo TaxID=212740 RepID=UPI00355A27C8